MELSLIIPVYNVEKYVEKCLRSCVKQNLPFDQYEIIVVNDGTKDRSLEIVQRVAKEFSNIKIVSQANTGLSAVRNKGLSLSTGKYVWFIDSDDWIRENCLKKIVENCIGNNLDILMFVAANMFEEDIVCRYEYKECEGKIYLGRDFLLRGWGVDCVPFSVFRRDFLMINSLYFYQGIFHEDSEFSPRAYYLAQKVSYLDDLIYYVCQNPTSITRSINPKKSYDLINVCQSLHDFMQNKDYKYRVIFHDKIALNVNNSLHGSCEMKKDEIKKINQAWSENKYLFKHLISSSIVKYRLEGLLFAIFGWMGYVQVYKLIQSLNFKKKG